MRRLDGVSAFMIYNDLARCYQHTLKVAILDFSGSAEGYSYAASLAALQHWVDQYQVLRWKIARVPLGLNHPVWVEDLEFDIRHHVTRIACPAPGDGKAFDELVGQLYAQTLDKQRPLWRSWVVEGLQDGKIAMVACLHHAYADGIGASKLLLGFAEDSADRIVPSGGTSVRPGYEPGSLSLLVRGLIDLPFMFLREIPPLAAAIWRARRLEKQYRATGGKAPPTAKQAPDSPFNAAHSHRRTFAHRSIDLAQFKEVSKAFGGTINDLLLACVAGGVRSHYQEIGVSPDKPLVANIPLDVRTPEQAKEILGNFVGNSFMWLPIEYADAKERLVAVSASANTMKEHNRATGGSPFLGIAGLMHGVTYKWLDSIVRKTDGQLKILGNITISNVCGPTVSLKIGEGRVSNFLSIGQVTAGVGVNVTAWSFNGYFNICLMADAKVLQDGPGFLDKIQNAFAEYRDIANNASAALSAPSSQAPEV